MAYIWITQGSIPRRGRLPHLAASAKMLRLDPHFRIPGHHLGLGLGLRNHGITGKFPESHGFSHGKNEGFLDIMRYYIYIYIPINLRNLG